MIHDRRPLAASSSYGLLRCRMTARQLGVGRKNCNGTELSNFIRRCGGIYDIGVGGSVQCILFSVAD